MWSSNSKKSILVVHVRRNKSMNDKDVNILFWTNALKGKIGQDNKKILEISEREREKKALRILTSCRGPNLLPHPYLFSNNQFKFYLGLQTSTWRCSSSGKIVVNIIVWWHCWVKHIEVSKAGLDKRTNVVRDLHDPWLLSVYISQNI